jgi:hypothetical protein
MLKVDASARDDYGFWPLYHITTTLLFMVIFSSK